LIAYRTSKTWVLTESARTNGKTDSYTGSRWTFLKLALRGLYMVSFKKEHFTIICPAFALTP